MSLRDSMLVSTLSFERGLALVSRNAITLGVFLRNKLKAEKTTRNIRQLATNTEKIYRSGVLRTSH